MTAYFGRSDVDGEPGRVVYGPRQGGVADRKEKSARPVQLSAPEKFDFLVKGKEVVPDDENCAERSMSTRRYSGYKVP